MTIDVAKLRDEAARHPDSRPDVYGIELSELLDAYEERDRLRRALEAVKRHADTPGKEELHHYNGDIHAPNCPGCRLREFVTRALAAPEGRDD